MKFKNFPYASSPFFAAALAILGVLLAVKIFDISYPISVTTRIASGELSVVGEGKVDVAPDTASVEAGIVVSDVKTVSEAEKKISETNNNIVTSLEKLGIDKKDVKTTNYSISPNYNYEAGKNAITGYNGNATLSIKIRKIEMLPQVVTSVTGAGANQVYNTSFAVDDPGKAREEAREKAIQNAKEQAEKLARSLGIKLGRIVNIVESAPQGGPISILRAAPEGLGGAAPDLQPGTQTITSVVTLYFEKR